MRIPDPLLTTYASSDNRSSLFGRFNLSLTDGKIYAVAMLLFTVLSFMIYRVYRRRFDRLAPLHSAENHSKENVFETSNPLPPLPKMSFSKAFNALGLETPKVESLPFKKESCRFRDILCPEESRIEVPGTTETEYLHANLVHLGGEKFILTQYPLPQRLPLFWKACEEACLIVDLTQKGEIENKEFYALEKNGEASFKELTVHCTEMKPLNNMPGEISHYSVVNKENESESTFEVSRIHHLASKDYKGINEDELDKLIDEIDQVGKNSSKPLLIHCRAGVGRSGTLAVVYALHHLIKAKAVNASNLGETIRGLILEGRRQRGEYFVQTWQQFKSIWVWSWRALHRSLN